MRKHPLTSANGYHPILVSPPPPPRKSHRWSWIISGVLIGFILASVVVVFLSGISVSSIFPNTTLPSSILPSNIFTSDTQTPTISQANLIGQPVAVNTQWTVTLNSVTISNGNKLDQPAPEHTYLVVTVTLQNTSTRILTASSIHMFDIKDANTGQTYQQDTSFGQSPDGTVASGGFITGHIAYEVPSGHHTFTLQFAPDVNGSVLAEWTIMI